MLKHIIAFKFIILRSGTYEIQEAENVEAGTKIVIHLKTDSREFSDEDKVKGEEPQMKICFQSILTKSLF